jgi:hypothetical protein
LCGIARHIEQLNLAAGFETFVICESPNSFFIGRNFKNVRLIWKIPVTKVIAKNSVSIGQALTSGQRLASMHLGFFGGFVLPGDLFIRSQLHCACGNAEQIIAVGKPPTILWMLAGIFPFNRRCGRPPINRKNR